MCFSTEHQQNWCHNSNSCHLVYEPKRSSNVCASFHVQRLFLMKPCLWFLMTPSFGALMARSPSRYTLYNVYNDSTLKDFSGFTCNIYRPPIVWHLISRCNCTWAHFVPRATVNLPQHRVPIVVVNSARRCTSDTKKNPLQLTQRLKWFRAAFKEIKTQKERASVNFYCHKTDVIFCALACVCAVPLSNCYHSGDLGRAQQEAPERQKVWTHTYQSLLSEIHPVLVGHMGGAGKRCQIRQKGRHKETHPSAVWMTACVRVCVSVVCVSKTERLSVREWLRLRVYMRD